MPKEHERERKIKTIKSGQNVRPPKTWFNKMLKNIREEYPDRTEKDHKRIVAGIWNNYDDKTKINVIKEYQTNKKEDISEDKKRILGKRNI